MELTTPDIKRAMEKVISHFEEHVGDLQEQIVELRTDITAHAGQDSHYKGGARPSYDEDRGALPTDAEELEAAGEILDNTKVSPMSLWQVNALDIMKSILQDSDTTGRFLDVEKEAMPGILQKVEDMVEHLRNMPSVEEHICSVACTIGLGHHSPGGNE